LTRGNSKDESKDFRQNEPLLPTPYHRHYKYPYVPRTRGWPLKT